MEAISDILKKHPFSIIAYILYMWTVISLYRSVRADEAELILNHGVKAHGVREDGLSPFIFGFIFIIVTMANILAKKNEMKFYVSLLILIIVPIIILGNMN